MLKPNLKKKRREEKWVDSKKHKCPTANRLFWFFETNNFEYKQSTHEDRNTFKIFHLNEFKMSLFGFPALLS